MTRPNADSTWTSISPIAVCCALLGCVVFIYGKDNGVAVSTTQRSTDMGEDAAMTKKGEAAIETLLNDHEWASVCDLPDAWRKEFNEREMKRLIVALLRRLSSTKAVKLDNVADLAVKSRVKAKKMTFEGHGMLIDQDVFIEGGRSAWAVEQLLDCHLPAIEEGLSKEELSRRAGDACFVVIECLYLPKRAENRVK